MASGQWSVASGNTHVGTAASAARRAKLDVVLSGHPVLSLVPWQQSGLRELFRLTFRN